MIYKLIDTLGRRSFVALRKICLNTAFTVLFFVVMGLIGYFVAPYIEGDGFAEISKYFAIGFTVLLIARVLNVEIIEQLLPTKVYVMICGLLPFFGCATAALAPVGSVERDFMWIGMAGILMLTAMYPVSIFLSQKKGINKGEVSIIDNSIGCPVKLQDTAGAEVLAQAEALLGIPEEPRATLTVLTRGIITEGFCPHDSAPLEVETMGSIVIARCPKCREIFTNVVRGEEGIERKSQLFTMREVP